jgi:hypothetical protein
MTQCTECGGNGYHFGQCSKIPPPKPPLKDRLNLYLQAAHLQATNMRGDAIANGDRKGRWFAEGQRDAIEAMLKKVNEDDT